MTLPRELALAGEGTDLVLIQRPPAGRARLRGTGRSWANETISGASTLLAGVRGKTMEISATFRVYASTTATHFGLKVRGDEEEATTIGYNRQSRLYIDRSHSGGQVPGFGAPQVVVLRPRDDLIELHILVDTASLEVFADGCSRTRSFPAAQAAAWSCLPMMVRSYLYVSRLFRWARGSERLASTAFGCCQRYHRTAARLAALRPTEQNG